MLFSPLSPLSPRSPLTPNQGKGPVKVSHAEGSKTAARNRLIFSSKSELPGAHINDISAGGWAAVSPMGQNFLRRSRRHAPNDNRLQSQNSPRNSPRSPSAGNRTLQHAPGFALLNPVEPVQPPEEPPPPAPVDDEPPPPPAPAHEDPESEDGESAKIGESIRALVRPRTKPWDSLAWLEVRQLIMDEGKIEDIPPLMATVSASTEEVLQRRWYETEEGVRVDLSKHMRPREVATWYGRCNVSVPTTAAQRNENEIAPPLIISDQLPLEVLNSLEFIGETHRPINVVLEVEDFDDRGHLKYNQCTSILQQNLMLRTDFQRYFSAVGSELKAFAATPKEHLQALHDPYVCLCQGVTMFRGPREDGYAFLETPVNMRCIISALHVSRPAVNVLLDDGSQWYTDEKDQTAVLERLNLIGLCALQKLEPSTIKEKDGKEALPILVISAMGCLGRAMHPRDAIANSLKHWRHRYAHLFHTVIVACGPDLDLAYRLDRVINGQVYDAAVMNQSALISKWHWQDNLVALHINTGEMTGVALIVKNAQEKEKRTSIIINVNTLSLPANNHGLHTNLSPNKLDEELAEKLEKLDGDFHGKNNKVEEEPGINRSRKNSFCHELGDAL